MKERLQFFPITTYAIVMGLSGLTIVFSKYYHLHWLPKPVYDAMLFFTFGVFLLISFLYGLKAVKHFDQVKIDFNHRIRVNFFSAISISFLLLSIALLGYWPILALVMWWVGVILHTFLMLHTIAFWVNHNFEINHMNPAWFIPVVGNVLVPVAGVEFMPHAFSFFYFAVGMFFWLVLIAIFLNRVIFHNQLLNIMLFFVALLFFLRKSFYGINFFISWWAFTFPLTATTVALAVAFQVTAQPVFKYASWVMFVFTLLVISFVSWHTILKIKQRQICINED